MEKLKDEGPTAQEITNIKATLLRGYETNSRQNAFVMSQLVGRYQFNEDPAEAWKLPEFYNKLDAEGIRIGNALWRGEAVSEETQERLLALFAMRFAEPARVPGRLGDQPAYLLLGMTSDRKLRFKPQNLIIGLPPGLG